MALALRSSLQKAKTLAGTAVLPLIPILPDGGLNTGSTVPGPPIVLHGQSSYASISSSTIKAVGLSRLAPLSPAWDFPPSRRDDQASDRNQRKYTDTGY